MNTQIARQSGADTLEQVLMTGDLKALSPEQRVTYYNRVCESVGLNPLTRPFDYLTLNNRLILYARKDAADQLRNLRGVSITDIKTDITDDLIVVTVKAENVGGRTDTDLGVVTLTGLKGDAKANAIMKAITKAKRRVTLSICGLGWLDETEVETIPEARTGGVDLETGEVLDQHQPGSNGNSTAGKPAERPFDAETIRNMLQRKAAARDKAGEQPTAGMEKMLVPNLEGLFQKEYATDRRRALTEYVFGVTSSKDLTGGQKLALVKWMGYVKDEDTDEWVPDLMAVHEGEAVYRAHMLEKGQAEMFEGKTA